MRPVFGVHIRLSPLPIGTKKLGAPLYILTPTALLKAATNKIKVLKRVSFGLRNFERFRNRILYINTRNEKGHALYSVHVLSRSA